MKILFVFNHPAPYKVRLFNELAKHVDLDVVFERTHAKNRPMAFYNCNKYEFNVRFLKNGYFGNENSISSELLSFIKQNHKFYDLIIMNGYSTFAEMKAIRYMIKNKIPYYFEINGGIAKKEGALKSKIKRYFISHAEKCFSPCIKADEYLIHYGVKPNNIYHYAYSTFYESEVISKQTENKNDFKTKLGLPQEKLFVTCGQFIERKNNQRLINIFKNRRESLLLIGSGKEKKKYERLIKQQEIKNIFIMNFVEKEKLFEIFKCCDGYITLSKEDIYGHTIAEAMANGLPVISSKNVISSHKLINKLNGYVVDINDDAGIINAIENIDNTSFESIAKTARENTIEQNAKDHLNIFKELLK